MALQVSSTKRTWAPGRASEPERHVLRNDRLILTARRVRAALAGVSLDYLAAQVLYRHVWQSLALSRLAEFLAVSWYELADARRRMVEQVAAHLQAAGLGEEAAVLAETEKTA